MIVGLFFPNTVGSLPYDMEHFEATVSVKIRL